MKYTLCNVQQDKGLELVHPRVWCGWKSRNANGKNMLCYLIPHIEIIVDINKGALDLCIFCLVARDFILTLM